MVQQLILFLNNMQNNDSTTCGLFWPIESYFLNMCNY
jgi:hypothetical protein